MREHAAELLDDDDRAAIESSHAAYYATLAEATVLIGVTESDAIGGLDLELDNFRAAFDRAEVAGDDETALRIATALYYYWYLKGYFREGRDRIRRPLVRGAGSARLQALACGALAGLTWLLGDGEEAEALAKRGIDTGTHAGALEAVMRCHTVLGMVARDRGDLAAAASHMASSGALADDLGLGEAAITANTNLAELALLADDLDEARRRWEGTLAWNHEHGIAEGRDGFALLGLGAVAYRQSRLGEAAEHFSRALELSQRAGFRHNVARGLVGLAAVAADRGEHTEAASLLGRASRLIAETGGELSGVDAALQDRANASCLAALGPERLEELLAAGAQGRTSVVPVHRG